MNMKILADANIPYVGEAFGTLGETHLIPGREIAPAHVRDADILLTRSVTRVNAELLGSSQVCFVSRAIQIADDKPVGEQTGKQNDGSERKAGDIRTGLFDQYSNHDGGDDTGEIAGKVFRTRPYSDLLGWRATLKDDDQVAGGKADDATDD